MRESPNIEALLADCDELYKKGAAVIQVADDLDAVEQVCVDHYLALVRLTGQILREILMLDTPLNREQAKESVARRILETDAKLPIIELADKRSRELIRRSLESMPERSRAVFLLERFREWLELEEGIILMGDLFTAYIFDVAKVQPLAIVAAEESRKLANHVSERWALRTLGDMERKLDYVTQLRNSTRERLDRFSLLKSTSSLSSKPRIVQ